MDRKGIIPLVAALLLIIIGTHYLTSQTHPTRVIASTTTSLYQTGLLETLAQDFTRDKPDISIQFVAVGSGEALERAKRGDACLVFVHAPSLEKQYIEEGVLEYHKIIAFNYFVILGPPSDPANITSAQSPVEAFQKIYQAAEQGKALFVSRGDRSGTHVKEMSIWQRAGLDPTGKQWYMETGQGMSETLVIASERGAYTISDIGTYLKLHSENRIPGLTILYSGGTELLNIYSAYLVTTCTSPERDIAKSFIDYVAGPEGQHAIATYGVDTYGTPLFYKAQDNQSWLQQEWQALASG